MPPVLVLGYEEVFEALPMRDCIEAMADALAAHARGEVYQPLRFVAIPPGAGGFFGLMPAQRGGDQGAFSLKSLVVVPDNPKRGLDSHQGTVTLFDGETGVTTALLSASAITAIRTAAVTALATRLLARADARELAVLGAGVQAKSHLHALRLVRDFERVRLYSPNREHGEEVARSSELPVEIVGTAEEAVRGADVVLTVTSSREPVLALDWLAQGAHLNAVGASMPSAREIDVETFVAASVFPDNRVSLENEAGEYQQALREGVIEGLSHVRAEVGEVAAGMHPGRTSDTELTLFRSLGLGIEDLAAAQTAVTNARAQGLGTEVEL
jgi:ornithine cyclodeaminase/alanine dehydrogenase-like protein (mu-crystallin family)